MPTDMTSVSDSERPSRSVVQALAEKEGVRPNELPPLYDAIDLEALDRLCLSGAGLRAVTFTYQDYRIVVSPDGEVEVTRLEPEASPRL